MGRGQELLDAARKGDGRTVTKILALITKRSGPFTSLRRGAGVNVQDDNGYTPLHHACMNGHREIVHLLLSVDASPCVVDKKGATPLHLAAWKGDSTVVSMLLGHTNPPVNIDQKTNDQETALVIAAQFGFVDVVTRLIARGADVTLRNNKEESALDLAAQYGKLETVEQLLTACPQLIDPYRFPISRGRSFPTTPLHRATMNGHKEVVAYLIDAGIDPNIRTDNGTALHEGVRYLSASVVRVLLNKGADLKAVDRQGHSVQSLLATYPEEATRRVRRVIREHENNMKSAYESEDDPLPVQDSPTSYLNTHGMIKVLPTLGNNNDASTNLSMVTNTLLTSRNKTLPLRKSSHDYLITEMNRSCSSTIIRNTIGDNNSDQVSDGPEVSEMLYGNIDSINIARELDNVMGYSDEDCSLYGNLSIVNVAKELRGRVGSTSGSQNSLKKKPKPAPKPFSPPKQPSVIDLNELLLKSSKYRKESQVNSDSSKIDGEIKSNINVNDYVTMGNKDVYVDMTNEDAYVPMKNGDAYVQMKNETEYVGMEKPVDVNDNLPDDEKAKRYGDAGSKGDYTPMRSDYVIYTSKSRRSVPNMGYVQMTGNAENMYMSMDAKSTMNKRQSFPHTRRLRGKCDGVHLIGAEGCIFNSEDYVYTYVLKQEVGKDDLSPFIKKKIRMDQMPCFCHEEKGSEVFYSCEDIYALIDKNVIYKSISDLSPVKCNETEANIPLKKDPHADFEYDLVDKEYEPFKKEPKASTSSEEASRGPILTKRFSKIIRKKIEQAKQLMTDWKAPETQKNINISLSLSPSSSSLTKNHQSFVKKLASKCLGLKAKFNSAPNISNSSGLDPEVSAKSPNTDQKSSTNTLLIGNSKFFNKILSKKEESGEIVCNDEFDTISLDRLGTLNRDSAVNRSNRSCPGFKTSLPNISENAELSDTESVIITEIDYDGQVHEAPKEAINVHTKFTIFEPRESTISSNNNSVIMGDSADLVNECYEPCAFSDSEVEKSDKSNNLVPKPMPRVNVAVHSSEEGVIYENITIVNKPIPPKPAVRNNVPSKIPLDEIQRKALYENVSILREKTKDDSDRLISLSSHENTVTNVPSAPPQSRSPSISSDSSDDSMEDESNLEDILLSEKSKSFKRGGKLATYPSKSIVSKSISNSSNVSDFTEVSAIENVDCSEEIYTSMSGTLPHKTKKDPENKKKVLFRHKTFTNIEVDRNSLNLKKTPDWHNEFMKETLAHYHIRGTGHCIHKAPTVEEFIYIFNRETLYTDTPPFSKVPNDKRDSYFETAICFCKPKVPKYHNSAEDLLELPFDEEVEENKVTIDVNALRARNEIISTSFRCFCDSGTCTFHSKKRESPNNLIVKFSAVKRSISTPDITLDSSFSAVNRSSSMKHPSEIHYAVSNIEDIILRNKKIEINNPSSPKSPVYTTMSQPSTISSSVGHYSIKDIAEVISLNSHSESADASPVCALNSVHLPLRKSTSSEYSGRWTLASCNSNTTVQSDASFKTCHENPDEDSDDGTLHSDEDSSDAETVKSDVSTAKRPWVHSDSFNFGNNGPRMESYAILEEDSDSSDIDDCPNKFESSKVESGISVGGSDSSSSGCDEDSGVPGVGAVSLGVASLERGAGCGGVRSGSGRRRWEEAEGTSEGDALSVSSAASSCAPHLAHHHDYSKVSPTPPKKPPRRNLSVSPTHANSPSSGYSYELRPHARSQDDLDEIQGAKHYLKHGRSVDQYVDGKLSFSEFEENHNSPRVAPVPNPRPSLKLRSQPVAITAMYENVVIKEQNPRRKLRRNIGPTNENHEPRMEDRVRKYSNQDRSSLESLLDDQSMNSPSDCERYDGQRTDIPLSPTHYEQPPTPDHPPPTPRQAENSIHERIRPLSQEYKRRSMLRDSQIDTEYLLRAMSVASVASGATDRSGNTDNCVEEYVCDVPFAGLFKGSTTTLDGIGLRPMPAERPKTLRKLKSVYDASPTEQTSVNISSLSSNGQSTERNVNGCDDEIRRRSNTTSSTHSADKSLSILSPFDEQEEWAKISEIMASFGSKLVRESVFVSELEQEFTSRLGLSCSESSLSPSVASNLGLWLSGLGLHDYEPLFLESGYDDVDFVNGILDENDLREMGIEENDRQRILESAKQLPLKITEISNNYNNNNISKNQNESVEEWLRNINLEIYNDTFRKHLYVDMDRVRRIWEVELTAVLEIQKAGHRKRILASVSGEHNGPANHMDINADLNSLKNNIKQLKDDIKEKLPVSENLKPVPPPVVPSLAPPGGETLKRSKKNRPAPQPPRPSDLEIRAPSELLVGVPGALKTQWKHQPFVLVTGAVTYVANYLGSTVVKELRGTESTKKSIQKLKKSTKEPRDSPDIILSISYRGVKFLNTITRELICEHEIRNIHCACQDADDLTHFAYITKDHNTKSHYCHVFRVATMDQATEVILTLGEAFEVAYQMALREQSNRARVTQSQAKTPTHDPMTTTNKEKPNVNHGRSHSITEIKLNGHQLKIAPMPASLSNEDFQASRNSDGSRSPRTPLLKAPMASTEEL